MKKTNPNNYKKDEQILEHGLEIMKNIYDGFVNDYTRTHTALLGLFAAGVTISAFILTGWDFKSFILLPVDKIFLIIGIGFILFSFWNLQHTIDSFVLPKPGDVDKYKNLKKYKNYVDYLKVMHDDYAECIRYVSRPINKRNVRFSLWMRTTFIGIVSLIIVKMEIFKQFEFTNTLNDTRAFFMGISFILFILLIELINKIKLKKANKIWDKHGDVHLEIINKMNNK